MNKNKSELDLSLLLRDTANSLGKPESFVLEEIQRVCSIISSSIHFGYFDKEDIEQEGMVLGLTALALYDSSRPLANFLYTHIHNRILNLQRKLLTRTDPPCTLCHQVVLGHSGHADGKTCESYKKWHKTNSSKRSLMEPMELEGDVNVREQDVDPVDLNDILRRIDSLLPIELRSTYLRMRAGESVKDSEKTKVESFIKEILSEGTELE